MKRASRGLSWAVTLALALGGARAEASEARRFALLIANAEGGRGTVSLRHVRADAEKLGNVLLELGGYREGDLTYLFDASADDAKRALAQVEAKVERAKAEGAETTLLVYYSGHAREGALHLGPSRWPMTELRGALFRSAADVRLGVIDACQAGAITRLKGGRPGPSFIFDADDGQPTRGLAFVTSSSDDEGSQESDELGGSYFTHYLTSGLRGDADESGDKRVTLGEVYLYAYHKTIQGTVATRSGVQHPTYSYDLKGSGHLVMTDLSRGRSGVVFSAGQEGEYLIFDVAREQVAAEVKKAPGRIRRIALAPGSYVVKKRLADHLQLLRFTLAEGGDFSFQEASMERVAFEDDYAKGPSTEEAATLRLGLSLRLRYQAFLSASARSELVPPVFLFGGGVELGAFAGASVGVELAFGGRGQQSLALETLTLAYDFSELAAAVEMIWTIGGDRLSFLVGPRLAGLYLARSFADPRSRAEYIQDHFNLSPVLATGGRLLVDRAGHFVLEARLHLGLLVFGVDENRALLYAEGGLTFGHRW